MDMDNIYGLMARYMMETLKMDRNMEEENGASAEVMRTLILMKVSTAKT